MNVNREKLLNKMRHMMNRTTENGCTEAEALEAVAKIRALQDAYEVTDEELNLTKEEKAILRKEPPGSSDPHSIKASIALSIATFCDCKVWRGQNGLVYCGLPSDAQFATWLVDTLAAFVQASLTTHLMSDIHSRGDRRLVINGFVIGCTRRISERLDALCAKQAPTSNGRALVVVKSQAVADRMKADGIELSRRRSGGRRQYDEGAMRAGHAAGNGASFGRPVTGNAGALRLN